MAKQSKKHLISEIITFVVALVTFIFAIRSYFRGKDTKKHSKKKR